MTESVYLLYSLKRKMTGTTAYYYFDQDMETIKNSSHIPGPAGAQLNRLSPAMTLPACQAKVKRDTVVAGLKSNDPCTHLLEGAERKELK